MKCIELAVVVKIVLKRQTSASMTDYAVSSSWLCMQQTDSGLFCLARSDEVDQIDTGSEDLTKNPIDPGQPMLPFISPSNYNCNVFSCGQPVAYQR